jgi:hypothetical protein
MVTPSNASGQKLTAHEGGNASFEDEPMDQDKGDDNAGHVDDLPVMPHSSAEKCTGRNEGRGMDEGAKAVQKLTAHEGSNTSFEDEPVDQDRGDNNTGHVDDLPVMLHSLAEKCTGQNEGRAWMRVAKVRK